MTPSRLALLVVGFLLLVQAAAPQSSIGEEPCIGKYKGGLKPSPAELAEILKEHGAWLKEGGEFGLANGSMRGNLCGADLTGADLGGADLRGASLIEAHLNKAHLELAH